VILISNSEIITAEDRGQLMSDTEVCETLRKRYNILNALRDTEKSKVLLEEELEVSRSTINRGVNELQESGLVERKNGNQSITLFGALALSVYQEYNTIVDKLCKAKPLLQELPEEINLDVRMIYGSSIELAKSPAPHKPLQEIHSKISGADRVQLFTPTIIPNAFETYVEFTQQENTLTLVFPDEVINHAKEHHCQKFDQLVQSPYADIFRTDGRTQFGIIIIDQEEVWLTVHGELGETLGTIYNDADYAIKWASENFERYREVAETVSRDKSS
jgi:predicted transcriptional regulator